MDYLWNPVISFCYAEEGIIDFFTPSLNIINLVRKATIYFSTFLVYKILNAASFAIKIDANINRIAPYLPDYLVEKFKTSFKIKNWVELLYIILG